MSFIYRLPPESAPRETSIQSASPALQSPAKRSSLYKGFMAEGRGLALCNAGSQHVPALHLAVNAKELGDIIYLGHSSVTLILKDVISQSGGRFKYNFRIPNIYSHASMLLIGRK